MASVGTAQLREIVAIGDSLGWLGSWAATECGPCPKMERKIPVKILVLFFGVAAEEH